MKRENLKKAVGLNELIERAEHRIALLTQIKDSHAEGEETVEITFHSPKYGTHIALAQSVFLMLESEIEWEHQKIREWEDEFSRL